MVYAANGGLVIGDTAIVARFKYAERAGEAQAYAAWMTAAGYTPASPNTSTRARAICWWSAR